MRSNRLRRALAGAMLAALATLQLASAQPIPAPDASVTPAFAPQVGQAGKDVMWVPTNQVLVDRMLEMARLVPQDRLVDLGSGDGRLVITAAQRGATARGIEYNPDLVTLARRTAAAEGIGSRVRFDQADIFESDFKDATVVTLFLLPDLNLRLRPTLLAMKPGTRIVSNTFNMGDWQPDESAQVVEGCANYCMAHKWIVPAQIGGTWRMGNQQLTFRQQFQMVSGSAQEGGATLPITAGRLDGERVRFNLGGKRYVGAVTGDTIRGTVDGTTPWSATRQPG
jgi:hypothetical protein